MKQHQRLYAAVTSGRGRFCVAVTESGDQDDPYSFLFSYDAAFAQPWARVDVRRVVNSLTISDYGHYIALSTEGDVYTLLPDAPLAEKIPDAGTYSSDAIGLGATIGIASIGGLLHVVGDSGQVYRRDAPGSWTSLAGPGLCVTSAYSGLTLRAVAGLGTDLIYVAGHATFARRALSQAESDEMVDAGKRGDTARVIEILNSLDPPGVADTTIEGRAFFHDAAGWTEIARPNRHSLDDILVERPDTVWITGFNGTILRGSAATGFQAAGFYGDTETILSITRFHDRYVCAADHSLHWFNGHNLSPLRPTTTTGVISPLKVAAVDDVLFYFDYRQGVHRFDGTDWTAIPIPPRLLERTLPGAGPATP